MHHYLKAAGLPVCLLLNFGKFRLEIKTICQWTLKRHDLFACIRVHLWSKLLARAAKDDASFFD